MSAGSIAVATVWFAVFAVAALLMGRSALGDWREGAAGHDTTTKLFAAGQWWPAAIAAVVAVAVPVALVVSR